MEAVGKPMVVRDFPDPEIGPRDALIKVEACGICRSDWHLWQGDLSWAGMVLPTPTVLGHEQAGIVQEVGSEVKHISPGMRVLTPFHSGCGTCADCLDGQSNICSNGGGRTGGFAQYAAIGNADFNAIPLPASVSFEAGAALGCRYMTSYHAVADRGAVKGGQWMAVHGCGGIGLSAVQIGAALGAQVIAVDLDEGKLAMARAEGAAETVNAGETDAPAAIREITGGGAHVSLDALGIRATMLNSLMSLRKGGIHVQVGITTAAEQGQVELPIDIMTMQELEFRGSLGNPNQHYRPLMQMVDRGVLKPDRLVSRTVSLEETPAIIESMTDFGTMGFVVINQFG
jgi:propanol-preferring alcohol dehydrogenase